MLDAFLIPSAPILILFGTACLLVALECLRCNGPRTAAVLAALGTLGALAMSCSLAHYQAPVLPAQAPVWLLYFGQSFLLDAPTIALFCAISAFATLAIPFLYFQWKDQALGEILILLLFIAGAMLCLVSANDLLMVFLSLEFLSLPLYVLVALRRKTVEACEAALKYFLYGSLASVFLLLGIALLYSKFGTLHIGDLSLGLTTLVTQNAQSKALLFTSLVFLLVASGFKVGLAPFHMWVPDVYQGASSSVTGFMGSAVKVAGFGLLLRVFWGLFAPWAVYWSPVLASLAVLTIFVGNIAALRQDNLKRLFAYSSISHAGYLLLGMTTISLSGFASIYYYLVVYGVMFIGFFGFLCLLERNGGETQIHQLTGLGFTNPVLGAALAFFALSAAGIPPTTGFFSKYFLFLEAVRGGKTLFVVLAVLGSAVGVYYYLRVIVFLYLKEGRAGAVLVQGKGLAWPIVFCALLLAGLAICPNTVLSFALGRPG